MSESEFKRIFPEFQAATVESSILIELDEKDKSIPNDANNFFVSFPEVQKFAENSNTIVEAKMVLMAISRNKFGIILNPLGDLKDQAFAFSATRMKNFNKEN